MPSHTRMFSYLVFAVLCTSCLAKTVLVHSSYSNAVGGGSGTAFSTTGQGRITGIRLWEKTSSHVTGIQLSYDNIWSARVGIEMGTPHEMSLFDGEVIVQVSGKYDVRNYIYQLRFVTSRGRSLVVGQPVQTSFNFYPIHEDAELRLLSGRFSGHGITSLGAHWGVVYIDPSYKDKST